MQAQCGLCLRQAVGRAACHGHPHLRRFPCIGRRHLDKPPQSAEALARIALLPVGAADALREYLHGDDLMLCAPVGNDAAVDLPSIRRHRQLSFDFAKLWPGA